MSIGPLKLKILQRRGSWGMGKTASSSSSSLEMGVARVFEILQW